LSTFVPIIVRRIFVILCFDIFQHAMNGIFRNMLSTEKNMTA